MKLEEKLQCEGYYGFGAGYEKGQDPENVQTVYCSTCSLALSCWEKHRVRVRRIFPEATKLFDEMARTGQGPKLEQAWFEKFGAADPYIVVLGGNLQDGANVGCGLPPKDRKEGTLPRELWVRLIGN